MPGPVPVHNAVPAGDTQFTVAAANPSRRSIIIYNDSAVDLFVLYGTGITLASFTIKIPSGYWGVMSHHAVYTGIITGILSAADPGSFAQVTELVN